MNVSHTEARDEYEPPYPDPAGWPLDEMVSPDADEDLVRTKDYYRIQQQLAEKALNAVKGEKVDGSGEIGLFKSVQITEGSNGDSYVVPTRILETPHHGIWQLDVRGRVQWFKQPTDFGSLRFTPKGEAGWIPHLFPFEEIDNRGLPVFLDRERANVQIYLTRLVSSDILVSPELLRLETPHGIFTGRQNIETWYNWGGREGFKDFDEFTAEGRKLYAEKVVLDTYSQDLDYNLGDQNEWGGEHFGSIWVPMDLLRSGINPLIIFPQFEKQQIPLHEQTIDNGSL